jgi:hypothetical protein
MYRYSSAFEKKAVLITPQFENLEKRQREVLNPNCNLTAWWCPARVLVTDTQRDEYRGRPNVGKNQFPKRIQNVEVFCFQALHLVVLWESLSIKRLGGFDGKNADKNSAL